MAMCQFSSCIRLIALPHSFNYSTHSPRIAFILTDFISRVERKLKLEGGEIKVAMKSSMEVKNLFCLTLPSLEWEWRRNSMTSNWKWGIKYQNISCIFFFTFHLFLEERGRENIFIHSSCFSFDNRTISFNIYHHTTMLMTLFQERKREKDGRREES